MVPHGGDSLCASPDLHQASSSVSRNKHRESGTLGGAGGTVGLGRRHSPGGSTAQGQGRHSWLGPPPRRGECGRPASPAVQAAAAEAASLAVHLNHECAAGSGQQWGRSSGLWEGVRGTQIPLTVLPTPSGSPPVGRWGPLAHECPKLAHGYPQHSGCLTPTPPPCGCLPGCTSFHGGTELVSTCREPA